MSTKILATPGRLATNIADCCSGLKSHIHPLNFRKPHRNRPLLPPSSYTPTEQPNSQSNIKLPLFIQPRMRRPKNDQPIFWGFTSQFYFICVTGNIGVDFFSNLVGLPLLFPHLLFLSLAFNSLPSPFFSSPPFSFHPSLSRSLTIPPYKVGRASAAMNFADDTGWDTDQLYMGVQNSV